MKCPKCKYVSHDYLDTCRKCSIDLVAFKQEVGLLVLQPGVLDLSPILSGAGADDLFESVDEEVTMHASDDDDFDINLDDYTEHPMTRRAPAGASRPGGRETKDDQAGMDHLTLELDASELSAEITARLQAAQVIPAAPPTPPTPAAPSPASPGAPTLPGHVTVEMKTESISTVLPPGVFQETPSVTPPLPQKGPETTGTEDTIRSLPLDVSHIDLGLTTSSANTPKVANGDEEQTESGDEVVKVTDFSGALALADETPAAPAKPASEDVDLTLPTIELAEVETTFAHMETERRAASEEAEDGSEMPEVVEPVLTTLDEPHLENISLPPLFEFGLDTLTEAETTLSDPAVPTLDEPPLTFADEDLPRQLPSREVMPTAPELMPEDVLTSSDMLALEDLEASIPLEHFTLELSVPALSADPASSLREDAPHPPPGDAAETAETHLSTDGDPALSAPEALPMHDSALPEHLTLELDHAEMTSHVSSITLDSAQLEVLPGDVKSEMSPPDDQGDDEEELLLDLDDLEFEDDEPA